MKQLQRILCNVVNRTNINLRRSAIDVGPYVRGAVSLENYAQFYAFYAVSTEHPLFFNFQCSSLAGSYFFGKCDVQHSVMYKCDVRGDELKSLSKGFSVDGTNVRLHSDEVIRIVDSFLNKTLIHSFSHDPEFPEEFLIKNTVALSYANIHGSPVMGSFLGPFSTIDLCTVQNSVIGAYAYVQVCDLQPSVIEPGRIWIRNKAGDEFIYNYPPEIISKYISVAPNERAKGLFMDFVDNHKRDFERVFGFLYASRPESYAPGSFVSRYAVVKGETSIGENVLVAQRAYLENARLGKGANAQENSYVVDSVLEGYDVTAHGAKIIGSHLGTNVFVGFNSFLRGTPEARLTVGQGAVIVPHTIIDLTEPVTIPPDYVVWGYVTKQADLATQAVSIEDFAKVEGQVNIGGMTFSGNGERFIRAFQHRIHHILQDNGAYYDGKENLGHAQKTKNITYNLIQPYVEGGFKGVYPNMRIFPLCTDDLCM
jgi:carbonic anhydrase/acetyltransferase-like protein (isoleucine patch superfamily)